MDYLYTTLRYISIVLAIIAPLLIAISILAIAIQASRISATPPNIPWVGLNNKRWFPELRATFGEVVAARKPMKEGYTKFSQHNLPFILPATHWPEIVLPPSNASWIAGQPEHVLSATTVFNDIMGFEYTAPGPDMGYAHDFAVVQRDLTRNLLKCLPEVLGEIEASSDELLGGVIGGGEEWKEVRMLGVLGKVAHGAASAMFVGQPLCRDKGHLKMVRIWVTCFALVSIPYRLLFPKILQPVFGPMLTVMMLPVKYLAVRPMLPIIKQRLAGLRKAGLSAKVGRDEEGPRDLLQWIVESAARKRDIAQLTPWDLAGKAILIEFLAFLTTSLTISRVFIDILSHPSASSLLDELREEADAVFARLPSEPTAVREMLKLDSVIRESLHLHTMSAHGLQREVVQAGGITTPDGVYLPQGSHVATFHPDLLDDDVEYDPLRSYKVAMGTLDGHGEGGPRKQKLASDISGGQSLAFGLGKHACPGRFFAVQNIKLVLGWMVTRYEFLPLEEEVKMTEVGDAEVPPGKTMIKVRRRRTSEKS
ncbi:hypothetical protein LTR56_008357 [Elasticomyces elasticus]|nr:hypothetical protein LTR56_008357 [Elasticomyces elasticus]KAK3661493.1 hypothetical protein LTR22_007503 [Elasticomyces elasticus]KAK4926150.1 hypothetical protein LTR49_006854 [Elasticomyces elasticus]KAK5756914.1 hypothetical protein LTS12_012993 [Elasticomyces elasticus]